ncbi:hypothetical protein ACEPAI_3835 [Sanghuangporus weigelae]
MSGYKTFAVAGAGGLGKFVVEALLAKKNEGAISSVSILSRSSSGHDDLVTKGAKVVVVDYSSSSSIKSAVASIDVVVSTLSGSPLGPQLELATGAKAAGVKLFVPSEFGNATDGVTEGFWGEKDAFKKKLKNEINLPYAAFYTGGFADFLFQKGLADAIGFDFTNGKITVPGEGTSTISWTTRHDIGRFVAYVLTQLPKEKLEWKIFRIEGDRTSFNQIIEDYKVRSGKNVSVAHRPRSELEERLEKNPSEVLTTVFLLWDKGEGASGKPEELANSEFPQWKPKKVVDVILEVYGN